MCKGCWIEMGAPAIVNDLTKAAADTIREVYEHSASGGTAHIVVDDWNLSDEDIDFCINDADASQWEPVQRDADLRCLHFLRRLTLDERASALAMFEGYITRETTHDSGKGQ